MSAALKKRDLLFGERFSPFILIHRQDRFCHRKCRPVLPVQAGSSGISRALAAWFPNPTVRAESRFPNPTVRAGSAGGLKRGTVASRTDRLREFICKIQGLLGSAIVLLETRLQPNPTCSLVHYLGQCPMLWMKHHSKFLCNEMHRNVTFVN